MPTCPSDLAYYQRHRERIRATARAKYAENPQKYSSIRKAWRENNRALIRVKRGEYLAANPEQSVTSWRHRNPEKNAALRARERANPRARLKCKLRCRINASIKRQGGLKSMKTIDLIGCDIPFLRRHIESQFKPGMTWGNHGAWHIDHIIPLAAFDLNNIEAQQEAFMWKNMQPLWAIDNLKKSCRTEVSSALG